MDVQHKTALDANMNQDMVVRKVGMNWFASAVIYIQYFVVI